MNGGITDLNTGLEKTGRCQVAATQCHSMSGTAMTKIPAQRGHYGHILPDVIMTTP